MSLGVDKFIGILLDGSYLRLPQKVNNTNTDAGFETKKVKDIISKCKESAYFAKKSLHLYDPLHAL